MLNNRILITVIVAKHSPIVFHDIAVHLPGAGEPVMVNHLGLVCLQLVEGSFVRHRFALHRDDDPPLPAATKMAQLIFRDQNYVSSAIHLVHGGNKVY